MHLHEHFICFNSNFIYSYPYQGVLMVYFYFFLLAICGAACLAFLDLEESIERWSPVATGLWEEKEGPRVHPSTSLSLSAIHPSPPLPSHGLCLWLNAGILSQRLPVAKRERAPEKLGKCMWVTASQKGAFHSLIRSFFLLLFVPVFFFCLFLSLWLAPSTLMSEKITLICVSPVYYSPGLAAKTRPNKIWNLVLMTY